MRMHPKYILPRVVFGMLISCFFSVGICMWGSPTVLVPQSGHFPAIQATSLDNAKLHLPRDFSGKLNLVVISFAREQQQDVDTWISAARQIRTTHSQFNYYELPTMSRGNLLSRWWFNAALRSDTTDKDLRGRILTAYINKSSFRKSLHIANEKQIVAVLVDREGKIYWHSDGDCTPEKALALLAIVASKVI